MGVYSQVARHPFINYDDDPYVTGNPHVRAGLTWETLTWASQAYEAGNWHPLTWLSHAADCELYGLNASGHHGTSLLIHCVNVVLLFLLLWRSTGATWKSLCVTALFAVHPLNVESVAWIAERKNVLSTMFFLLAIGPYGWYAQKPQVRRYVAVVLLFALGLASKPMVITLPFVLLLLDVWPLQRVRDWSAPSPAFPVRQESFSRLLLEKIPLLALSAASAVITIAAQGASVIPSHALPLQVRLETAIYSYSLYLWKMVWPVHLALIYPHPGRSLGVWRPLLGALLIVAVSGVAWRQRSKRRYIAVGWLWFLGTAVPIIGVIQVGLQVIADRYAYVPLIGVFVALVWGATSLADNLRLGAVPRAVAALAVVTALAFMTWTQLGYWRDSVTLWSHALEVTTNNSLAESYLANTLLRDGRYQEGMAHLRNYASLEPLDPEAHARVAADDEDRGQFADAAREYEAAIRASAELEKNGVPGLDPSTLAVTYVNLGLTYGKLGNVTQAADSTRKGLMTDRKAVLQMLQNLGEILSAHPTASGYVRLGMLLQAVGDADQARQAFARARRIDPAL